MAHKKKKSTVEESIAETFGANQPSLRSKVTRFITGKDDAAEIARKKAQKARELRRRRGR